MKIPPLAKFFKELIFSGFEAFGRYYSTYRGFVYSNMDPEGLSRLQVIVPEIAGDEPYTTWAYPIGIRSGLNNNSTGYGSQVLPQNGELVWVSFERGNPDKPLWQFGYRGSAEVNFDSSYLDSGSFWFTTPGGNTVLINDTNNYITVTLNTGQLIRIDGDGASIVHDKSISLGSLGSSAEPAVLGNSLNAQQKATLTSLSQLTVMTPMGPSSIPINANDFINQITSLGNMLSQKNTID